MLSHAVAGIEDTLGVFRLVVNLARAQTASLLRTEVKTRELQTLRPRWWSGIMMTDDDLAPPCVEIEADGCMGDYDLALDPPGVLVGHSLGVIDQILDGMHGWWQIQFSRWNTGDGP